MFLRTIRRENLCFFRPNDKFGCSLKLGYAKAKLLALLWLLYNEVMLVGHSEQEQYQRWDQKNAQLRRESWKRYQEARKFLNFFLVNMKSDVMASIFMFTKNVGVTKMTVWKCYIFSTKNTQFLGEFSWFSRVWSLEQNKKVMDCCSVNIWSFES